MPFSQLSHTSRQAILDGRTALLDFEQPGVPAEDRAIAAANECRRALFVPLVHQGDVIGHITTDERGCRHEFSIEEISMVEAIASQAAIALANARLLESEHHTAEMNRMLAEASRLLASTIELDKGLPEALEKVGSAIGASGIAVLLHTGDEWLMRHGWAVSEALTGRRFTAGQLDGHELVRRTRLPFFAADAVQGDAWSRRFGDRMGFASFAIKPMIVRGEFVGTVDFGFAEPRRFDDTTRDTLSRIVYAIASAIDNARLYEAEHNIAETLQDTLVALPERLTGVEYSSVYETATAEAGRVGGDFLDLFEVDDHTIGVVVGDVSGKGLDAAVITSLVRNTVRAHALDGLPPESVIAKTNTVVGRFTRSDAFVTMFFGLLDTESGELRYVSAGHPPALVVSPDGSAQELTCASPLLGALEAPEYTAAAVVMKPGERLVLYTDGVTEARSPERGAFYGHDCLERALQANAGRSTPELAAAIMADVLEFSYGVLRDDAAVLVVEPAALRA